MINLETKESNSIVSDPVISILVSSRSDGNLDSTFRVLFESIVETANNINNLELLVRVDEDDTSSINYRYIESLNSWYKQRADSNIIKPVTKFINYSEEELLRMIKIYPGPRNSGRWSLWEYYNYLCSFRSNNSKVILLTADDHMFTRNDWDLDIISLIKRVTHNYFFINSYKPDYSLFEDLNYCKTQDGIMHWRSFNFDREKANWNDPNSITGPWHPMISSNLFDCMQNWWNNSNDGWTYLLTLYLKNKWNLDLVEIVPQFYYRYGAIDRAGEGSPFHMDAYSDPQCKVPGSAFFWKMVEKQSDNIALNYFYETGIDNDYITKKISTS